MDARIDRESKQSKTWTKQRPLLRAVYAGPARRQSTAILSDAALSDDNPADEQSKQND